MTALASRSSLVGGPWRLDTSSRFLHLHHHVVSDFSLLQDDTKALKEYGVHGKTRLLVMRTAKAAASSKLATEEDRAQRLSRLRDAAAAVASRGDGRCASCCQLAWLLDTTMQQSL